MQHDNPSSQRPDRRDSGVVKQGRLWSVGVNLPFYGGIRYRGLTQEQVMKGVLPVDYEIEYICRGNRVIVGPKVRKCLPDGTWTDLTQHSRCLLPCARMWTSLENGRVSAWPLGPAVEGTVLQYSCQPGFFLVGRNTTHCTKVGKWDSPKPVCHCEYCTVCVSQHHMKKMRPGSSVWGRCFAQWHLGRSGFEPATIWFWGRFLNR
uniref:Sushi domain-containing protein n=1 Tax=Denticeps clupeoides TaxID=299321 RepID=A0AAY4BIM5_9TELE